MTELDLRDHIDGVAAIMAGTANVIMQLSLAPVGYGVVESKVESGQITKHPLKRFRTTFSFLAVAMLGTDEDRRQMRKAIDTAHIQVRSSADSPVKYNAMDPDLQLWVAAAMFWGAEDAMTRMRGPLDPALKDELYELGARFATTLQVKPDMWPADREAFAEYWDETVARLHIDDTVRAYLQGLIDYTFMPRPFRVVMAPLHRLLTVGFLPPFWREQMQATWTEADQRRFDRVVGTVAAVNRRMPRVIRNVPFNYFLWDVRRRVRTGKRLV